MYYPKDRNKFSPKIQAPFVLAQIRALRASIFHSSKEVQMALSVADEVAAKYDLSRPDLFIPAADTYCAIIEPLSSTIHAGTLRRIGLETFPQFVQILGIPPKEVRAAMGLNSPADLVNKICGAYGQCVMGAGAGSLAPNARATAVTDTTFMPCQLQQGVFMGAGKLTGLFRESAVRERQCRSRGADTCVYELAA